MTNSSLYKHKIRKKQRRSIQLLQRRPIPLASNGGLMADNDGVLYT